MPDRTIIMCAPNGARKTKADHPNLPMTPAELAACAQDVLEAGASMIHVHARDADGRHTLDADETRRVADAVRDAVGDRLVIQVTTEAVGQYTRQQQMDMVRAVTPEAVSLALRELCPDDSCLPEFETFYEWMHAEGVFPQIILYDDRDIAWFQALCCIEIFCKRPPFALLVLKNNKVNTRLDGRSFAYLKSSGPPLKSPWAMCGFGAREHEAIEFAVQRGGHVRVGFENNLLLPDGRMAERNADLVREARNRVTGSGSTPASAHEVREMFRAETANESLVTHG